MFKRNRPVSNSPAANPASGLQRRRILAVIGTILLLIGVCSAASPGQKKNVKEGGKVKDKVKESAKGEDTKEIYAAQYQEKIQDRLILRGNAEIRYRDLKVFADRIEYDHKTKELLAEGQVTIQLPQESVSADRVFVNAETHAWKIEKAEGMIQPTIFYQADEMESARPNVYRLDHARITSCAQPVPRWNFSTSRANLVKDDHVEMWNAVFRVKKVPVFYFPYMRYPLKDRATGFLLPQIGRSNRKGFIYEQGFYWAIARNMDATFNFNYYSARGIGGGINARYIFGGGTAGEINLFGFSFKKDDSGQKLDDAYILRMNHGQALPFGFNLVANVDIQSSFDFLREFDNNFNRAIVSNRKSEVYLQRSWSHYNLSARISRFETYYPTSATKSSIVKKSVPQISFNMFKAKLFSPLLFSVNSSFQRWEYGWSQNYAAGTQKKSGNLQFAPTLTLPFTSIPWLSLTASATARLTYYFTSLRPNSQTPIDEPLLTADYLLGLDAIGPVFSRIYRNKKGEPVFKHVIEPFAKFQYESPIQEDTRIITDTFRSFVPRYYQVEYGITNRFFTKEKEMAREVLQITLGQTFYLAPEEGPLKTYRVDGRPPQFSEVSGMIRYYPAQRASVDVSVGWNPYYRNISNLRLGANFGSRAEGRFFSLSWFKSSNTWVQDETSLILGKRHQISASAGLKPSALPFEIMGDIDYNIQERRLLYTAASAVYHYQCLDFGFELKVFYFRTVNNGTRPETQLKFSIGLGNIGKTTDFLGGMGF
jgi:LPS-assembly protein